MNRRGLLAAGLGVLAASGGGAVAWQAASGNGGSTPARRETALPQATTPVALQAKLPGELRIGVVHSLTSPPGEGQDWAGAAAGAQVAAERFRLGGSQVTLLAADDKGSRQGAVAAIGRLRQRGVHALVVATQGTHLRGTTQGQVPGQLPVLLPYSSDETLLGGRAWATGPVARQVDAALDRAVASTGASRPMLVDAGGGRPLGFEPVATVSFPAGSDPDRMVAGVKRWVNAVGRSDCVVVSGPAEQLAQVVLALQGSQVQAPVVLGTGALNPAFGEALAAAGGSVEATFTTIGPALGDPVALQPDAAGRAMSAWLAALRLVASDPQATNLSGDQPFATVAPHAEVRSHDAVVTLVRAAERAASTSPSDLVAALRGLQPTATHGLAGPALSFARPLALPAGAIRTLRSSTEVLGLRPTDPDTPLVLSWIAA